MHNRVSGGLEVCANSFTSALAAEKGRAIRVELCENMAEGGTTPSYGQIQLCKSRLNIPLWPIIRPRGGDFMYSDDEFEVMKTDVLSCKALKCDGVVTGILLPNGKIDEERCSTLIKLAHPMPVALHRAFDVCIDKEEALETSVRLGFVRILTSGGANNALEGLEMIASLVKKADNRVEIMPGAGVNPSNILAIKAQTGAKTFHSSARIKISSKMNKLMNNMVDLQLNEYEQTSTELVEEMVKALQQ